MSVSGPATTDERNLAPQATLETRCVSDTWGPSALWFPVGLCLPSMLILGKERPLLESFVNIFPLAHGRAVQQMPPEPSSFWQDRNKGVQKVALLSEPVL